MNEVAGPEQTVGVMKAMLDHRADTIKQCFADNTEWRFRIQLEGGGFAEMCITPTATATTELTRTRTCQDVLAEDLVRAA